MDTGFNSSSSPPIYDMRRIFSILFVLLMSLSSLASDSNGVVRIFWTYPTENLDHTPLTDLSGAKIYYGLSSSNYIRIVDAGYVMPAPGSEGTCLVTGLTVGVKYYFNGTAYNVAGLESGFCNEVSKEAYSINSPQSPIRLRFCPINDQ